MSDRKERGAPWGVVYLAAITGYVFGLVVGLPSGIYINECQWESRLVNEGVAEWRENALSGKRDLFLKTPENDRPSGEENQPSSVDEIKTKTGD